jgi:hypothetical protein
MYFLFPGLVSDMEIDIDRNIYEILSRRATENGFESAEEYSEVLLETVIRELESDSDDDETDTESDDDKVSSRLEDLGYLE